MTIFLAQLNIYELGSCQNKLTYLRWCFVVLPLNIILVSGQHSSLFFQSSSCKEKSFVALTSGCWAFKWMRCSSGATTFSKKTFIRMTFRKIAIRASSIKLCHSAGIHVTRHDNEQITLLHLAECRSTKCHSICHLALSVILLSVMCWVSFYRMSFQWVSFIRVLFICYVSFQ